MYFILFYYCCSTVQMSLDFSIRKFVQHSPIVLQMTQVWIQSNLATACKR